jgi:Eukaryotic aspartyl protease
MQNLQCPSYRGWEFDACRSWCVLQHYILAIHPVSVLRVVDTGSADLWVVSDACTMCSGHMGLYRQATFHSAELAVSLLYGDSRTGTHAFGLIGNDKVGITGFMFPDQYFAAINNTNTSVEETGSAGIFGLGFPLNRFVLACLLGETADAFRFQQCYLVYPLQK